MRRFVTTALLLLLPSVAVAGARQDIVDLRHDRARSHQEFLGWTDDGRAASRRLVCSEGGELSCRATIDQLRVGEADDSTLLWHNEDSLYDAATPQNPKGPISTAEAGRFIRNEAKARDALGPLTPAAAVANPAGAFGTIAGEPTEIYLRTSPHPTDEEALRLHVAVRGPRGAWVDLERLANEPWRIESQRVVDARVSPDGDTVWIALHYVDGVMCWDSEDIELTVADRSLVRATLANAAGMRAYAAGQLDEAYELFAAATDEDPQYAWGWFNRGALESRRGDTDHAATSLRRAIDLEPGHRERACGDEDYTALGATEDGELLMDCRPYDEGC
ncbi:MAG: tetratricopeptide repeat protein [Myxococcota bacterium]